MRQIFYRILSFGRYYWRAHTKYDVHSPFVFDFIQNVFEDPKWYYAFRDIELVRKKLFGDNRIIDVTDFGAGSQIIATKERAINAIAKSSLSRPFFCQLLFSYVHWQKPLHILELGTSLGIATSYLAKANQTTQITTLEGCPNIAAIARQTLEQVNAQNVKIEIGDFKHTLTATLQRLDTVDLFVLDGNHQEEATWQYFEQCLAHSDVSSCMIFDDIYWSEGMTRAWERIKAHSSVTLTIDVFQYGLVFFRKEHTDKQHFTLIPTYCKPWRMGFF